MKRFAIWFVFVVSLISLAACTPTSEKMKTEQLEEETPAVVSATGGAADKVPDPNAEVLEIISVYRANDDKTGLNQAMDSVSDLTADSLTEKLIEYGVLEEGTKVLQFENKDDMVVLDLTSVPSGDKNDEILTLTAIGNTFTENFQVSKLKLLVNGKNYSGSTIQQKDDDYLGYNKNYRDMLK